MKPFILKLICYGVLVGALVGVLELNIGHRFILDPLLLDKGYNFVYESYFAPTYYGFTKSIIAAITFFFVSLFALKQKLKPIVMAALTGILGTAIFGAYYYFTFPRSTFYSAAIIGIVHFSFIAAISYIFAISLQNKKEARK